MTGEQEDRGGAQVNWLVAGDFGLGETGRTLRLTRGDFEDALKSASISVRAEVPDTVGVGETRSVTLPVSSLKVFTLKHVMGAVPELSELAAKADRVAKLKSPSVEELKEIVGEGRLLDRLTAVIAPEESPAPSPGAAEATGDTDAIFEKAEVKQPTAKSAIDMFVRTTSRSTQKAKPAARKLRDLVEEAAWGLAADLLNTPEVAGAEQTWRGLRYLLTQCPKEAQMEVTLLQTSPGELLSTLEGRERADSVDEPDCIFVPHDYDTTDGLEALADHAEGELIPVVVGLSPSLFGCDDAQGIPGAFDSIERARNDEVPPWAQGWDELRLVEATRWLCGVANRVVLHQEGKGVASRTVLGSGVWAVAAMLANSHRTTGGFAGIFGKAGALRAPASHTISSGQYKDTAAPTEAFYAISPSEQIAKNGVLGLGSVRNSDQLALVKAPCVRGAKDVVPLPAQILTGRVVRFASWVKAQLPEGCDSKTANDIYTAAASVFLFPGQDEAAHVRAATTNIDGEAHVVVRATANPAIASIPFEIAFPLPLGWSVPAPESEETAPADGAEASRPDAGSAAEVKGDPGATKGDGVGLASASIGFGAGLVKPDDN